MVVRLSAIALVALAIGISCGDGDRRTGETVLDSAALTGTAGPQTIEEICGREPDAIVVIDDFSYNPALLTVEVGDTVAWVNIETCADRIDEEILTPVLGCDAHHQVVTLPPLSEIDNLDSGPICSPSGGVPAPNDLSPEAPDPASCQEEGNVNVFCHTFTEPGVQHYTCLTNAGHTAAMHGSITVLPEGEQRLL